ncbi:MAG: YfcE family phosphodiesterase [Tepidisphaeraceae bacterium]
MIIGILSDTHDRAAAMAAGIQTLRDAGATFFAHCGDIGSQACIDLLAGLPAAFVFGNTDWNRAPLARYAASIDVACYGAFGSLELYGKHIALLHGDDFRLRQRLIDEQQHDYLFQGHTHIKDDRRIGRMRLINPGALHRAKEKTVATLDTAAEALRFHIVRAAD